MSTKRRGAGEGGERGGREGGERHQQQREQNDSGSEGGKAALKDLRAEDILAPREPCSVTVPPEQRMDSPVFTNKTPCKTQK